MNLRRLLVENDKIFIELLNTLKQQKLVKIKVENPSEDQKHLIEIPFDVTNSQLELIVPQFDIIRELKPDPDTPQREQPKTIIHQCQICEKGFKSKSYLEKHIKNIHDRIHINHNKNHLQTIDGDGIRHKCSYCEMTIKYKANLKRHEMQHLPEKPFQCRFCSRGFVRKDKLHLHENAHIKKNKKLEQKNKSKLRKLRKIRKPK